MPRTNLWTKEQDALLRKAYSKDVPRYERLKRAVELLAGTGPEGNGRTRGSCASRAHDLGVAAVSRRWTQAEDDVLHSTAGMPVKRIRKLLNARGSSRSEKAIIDRCFALKIPSESPDYMNAMEVAELMGTDARTVSTWLTRGILKGTKERYRSVGSAAVEPVTWTVRTVDIKKFLIEHVSAWWKCNPDKYWLVEILTGRVHFCSPQETRSYKERDEDDEDEDDF